MKILQNDKFLALLIWLLSAHFFKKMGQLFKFKSICCFMFQAEIQVVTVLY